MNDDAMMPDPLQRILNAVQSFIQRTRALARAHPGYTQLFKIAVSLLLLASVLHLIDWHQSLALARDAEPRQLVIWLSAATALLLIERALSVFKWLLLLRVRGAAITFWRLLVINFIGGFWGLILPSSVSADVIRGVYLARSTANTTLSVTSMLVDRLMGAISLIVLGCTSAWVVGDRCGLAGARPLTAGLAVALVLGLLLLFHRPFITWMDKQTLARLADRSFITRVRQWLASCFEFQRYPGTLAASLGLTILVQAMRVLVFYAVAAAFGVAVPMLYYFIIVPLIMLLIMLPVSINGIGVREGSFVAFFGLMGVPAAQSFAVSFGVSLLTTLITALGGIFYMADRR